MPGALTHDPKAQEALLTQPQRAAGAESIAGLDAQSGGQFGPDASPVSGGASAPFVTVRYVSAPNFSAYDGRSFRQIFQVPFTGPCLVRPRYETDTASVTTVDSSAVAAGDTISSDHPQVAGVDSAWTVSSGIALTAASASFATDGTPGVGLSPWVLLDIPTPTDSGLGGYVYVGTRMATGGRCIVGNGSRPETDWEQTINGLLPRLKYRCMQNAGGDNVSTAQTSFVNATPTGSQYSPCVALDVIPLRADVIAAASFGDSTTQALGTGTPATQPYNYTYLHIAADAEQSAGRRALVANWAAEGKGTAFTTQRLINLLNGDAAWAPRVVFLQVFSVNETFDTATINAAFARVMTAVMLCRARGVKVVLQTTIPDASTNTTTDAARQAGNARIRSSGMPYLDRDAIVSDGATPARIRAAYTFDGRHLNRAGNEAIAPAAQQFLRVTQAF